MWFVLVELCGPVLRSPQFAFEYIHHGFPLKFATRATSYAFNRQILRAAE
jgi:hypothetical protein